MYYVLRSMMECLAALIAGKSEEMNVSTSFIEFRTKPCMMKSKQYFGSSVTV
jgi:hypothetical protein